MLGRVTAPFRPVAARGKADFCRIPQFRLPYGVKQGLVVGCFCLLMAGLLFAQENPPAQREAFARAWTAAARGDRDEFNALLPGLQDYLLYPYLQYEDLRNRRSQVAEDEMSSFLAMHQDWAFAGALKTSWLRSLASQKRWDALLRHGQPAVDDEVRCAYAQAKIEAGQTEDLLPLAQSLWTVGHSQPDACDPVFRWLQQEGGITPGLAWQRIRLAMEARQARLVPYLSRFLPEADRPWADRWYQQDRGGYRKLEQAARWSDDDKSRDIASFGLERLARTDADRAWRVYQALADHFGWAGYVRSGLLREIALWSAVEGSADTAQRMRAVPEDARDDGLLEWAARHALATGSWADALQAIGSMSPPAGNSARWRFWRARALLATGHDAEARALLSELAAESGYHGFLAADLLGLPYTVCPESPAVDPAEIEHLAGQSGFDRALELRRAGISNWARSEWLRAVRSLDTQGLRTAAGLAVREGWPEMAIFALGDSGDQRWYDWRFPLDFSSLVGSHSSALDLDPAWVMGLIRSESAMAVDALSGAGARGLMQLTPATAQQLAKRHGYAYGGPEQLMQAEENVRFGTTYLRDLLDRFGGNSVLVSGAYNAGPNAVDRWLKDRPLGDPAIWVESLPYRETRDYIPRVLAFATIYDWRMQRPVIRVSSRMPALDSGAVGGTMKTAETTEVVCRPSG
jgi:soluble lytic murein transglycosylase